MLLAKPAFKHIRTVACQETKGTALQSTGKHSDTQQKAMVLLTGWKMGAYNQLGALSRALSGTRGSYRLTLPTRLADAKSAQSSWRREYRSSIWREASLTKPKRTLFAGVHTLNYNKSTAQHDAATRYKVIFRQYTQKAEDGTNKERLAEEVSKTEKVEEKVEKKNLGIGARVKYFLLRQNRPFNVDEITAFFSWILMGNFIWIIIGTTTFFGVLIYILNWIGDGEVEKLVLKKLLTFDNKLMVDFSGPNFMATWEDGKIKIRNLRVQSSSARDNAHLNYQLDIAEINLTLSSSKWLDGKGLIDGIEIEGLQGDVNMLDGTELILDNSFHDNYELNHLKVKHSKISFHSETLFNKPLELVVFNCDMGRLRRKWMVYDFLNANTMFGSLGGSLFTLHKRQHRFAHFSGMDLHDEIDDYSNSTLNSVNESRQFGSTDTGGGTRFGGIKYKVSNDSNDGTNEHSSGSGGGTGGRADGDAEGDFWKKITRLRIDMLDLSFLNEHSKLNWIESGKAEVIFDIMLPNDDDGRGDGGGPYFGGGSSLKKDLNFEFSVDGVKQMLHTVYRKLTDGDGDAGAAARGASPAEMNKYVVIDMKINYFNLTAKYPHTLPCSSLTGLPYLTAKDLQSLVTFINDEKFGLSSSRFGQLSNDLGHEEPDSDTDGVADGGDAQSANNYHTGTAAGGSSGAAAGGKAAPDDADADAPVDVDDPAESGLLLHGDSVRTLPPIKFRIVQNLNDFEYLDLPSLLSFTSMERPDDGCDEKTLRSFINTNKFIDSSIVEVLALLLVYKDEIQTRLLDMYSRRSGFEILFNNFILGNLILVGLGSFVI